MYVAIYMLDIDINCLIKESCYGNLFKNAKLFRLFSPSYFLTNHVGYNIKYSFVHHFHLDGLLPSHMRHSVYDAHKLLSLYYITYTHASV